jgi:hypothetical protein
MTVRRITLVLLEATSNAMISKISCILGKMGVFLKINS